MLNNQNFSKTYLGWMVLETILAIGMIFIHAEKVIHSGCTEFSYRKWVDIPTRRSKHTL